MSEQKLHNLSEAGMLEYILSSMFIGATRLRIRGTLICLYVVHNNFQTIYYVLKLLRQFPISASTVSTFNCRSSTQIKFVTVRACLLYYMYMFSDAGDYYSTINIPGSI